MLGRFRFNDEPLTGDDGTFDPWYTVAGLGVVLPLLMIGYAIYCIWDGGVYIKGRFGAGWRYEGFQAVTSAVLFLLGMSALMVSKYLLPNVFRESYAYQYLAVAGGVLAFGGLIWFVAQAVATFY